MSPLKSTTGWQTADVVVALDDGCVAAATLDDVWIDGTLCEIIDSTDLLAFVFKNADEFFADDLALALWIGDAGKLAEKTLGRIDADEIHAAVGERCFNFVAFVFAHETVVNENAGELAANGFGNELRCNGAVYTAGEGEQHFSVANLGADVFDGFLGVICHGPVGVTVANFHEEIFEHGGAVVGVVDFRMILHGVELLFHVCHGCDRQSAV